MMIAGLSSGEVVERAVAMVLLVLSRLMMALVGVRTRMGLLLLGLAAVLEFATETSRGCPGE